MEPETMYTENSIGAFITKPDNALELIDWLERGAPHTSFNIDYGIVNINNGHEDLSIAVDGARDVAEEHGTVAPEPGCGTVVCIAGAACQMYLGVFGQINSDTNDLNWDDIQDHALTFLGIEYDRDTHGGMWPIFDPAHWSEAPSGPMAAYALVRYSQHGYADQAIWEAEHY